MNDIIQTSLMRGRIEQITEEECGTIGGSIFIPRPITKAEQKEIIRVTNPNGIAELDNLVNGGPKTMVDL